MESQLAAANEGGPGVLNKDAGPDSVGGERDVYSEDNASEDQRVTPWMRTVACGVQLLHDPRFNKGTAFTGEERQKLYLRGLLPPVQFTQDQQVERLMKQLRAIGNPLHKYMALMDTQERNERLFYRTLIDHVEELMPFVYTPTVGEACQKYGAIFHRPRGLYISLKDKGCVVDILKNWPEPNVGVIVVTDGERILGLGDLGLQGMGIPVGKLALYTALGGIRPSGCLPIAIDVGTNNQELLEDPFYIGLRQKRVTGQGKLSLDEARAKIWLVDSKGLVTKSRYDSLTAVKKPFAKEHEEKKDLLGTVQSLKPTVIIGTSAQPHTFTKEVMETMASYCKGCAIFASGSPFGPVAVDGKERLTGQSNNAYIFPGMGLGCMVGEAIRIHDDMFLVAAETLAAQVTDEHRAQGLVFPPLNGIREISARIGVAVAEKTYELGLATRQPRPKDLLAYAKSCMYSPSYRSFR